MLFFLTKRMPFVGVIAGVALLAWGLARHSLVPGILGIVIIVVSIVRNVARFRGRR